jgi:hypothetical protein
MQKLIDTVTGFYGTGIPPQKKLFRVKSGNFADRLIALYSKSSSIIAYSWSDPPYTSWSEPTTITNTSANQPFSAVMDGGSNLYLVFTSQTNMDLKFVKLTFSVGEWSVGNPVTVCNQEDNYYPDIMKEESGKLWVSWAHFKIPPDANYYLHVKSSTDDGVTWGEGPNDPGEPLTSGYPYPCYSSLVIALSKLFCVYTFNRSSLSYRARPLSGGSWEEEVLIYMSSYIDDQFSADSSPENRVGVAFRAPTLGGVCFKEYDGGGWSGVHQVEFEDSSSPALRYFGVTPYVFFTKKYGIDQDRLHYNYKSGESFSSSEPLERALGLFDKVFCYDDDAPSKYKDRTTEAGDVTSADVYHPTSGAMLKDADDTLYLGRDEPFSVVHAILSTNGTIGTVGWQYWNGDGWQDFTPYSGGYHFAANGIVYLWEDLGSVPLDWQQNQVNGESQYWVRAKTLTPFNVPPVGTQITAISDAKYLNVVDG